MTGKLFIISGPTGVGKTTVVNECINRLSSLLPIERLITYTTKKPRTTEKQGIDYFFISPQEFAEKHAAGFFLESSTSYGASYGSPADIITKMKEGRSFIAILDRAGTQEVLKRVPDAVPILLEADLEKVVAPRLRARGTEGEAEIQRRLAQSAAELKEEGEAPLYRYRIINTNLEETLEKLLTIFKKEVVEKVF